MSFRDLPVAARLYIIANIVVSGIVCIVAVRLDTVRLLPIQPYLVEFGVLLTLAVLFNKLKVELTVQHAEMTIGAAAVFLTIFLRPGLLDTVVIAFVGGISATLLFKPKWGRITWFKPALTTGNLVQSAFWAAVVWQYLFPETTFLNRSAEFNSIHLIKIVLLTAVYFLVNTLGISGAVALSQRLTLGMVWRDNFSWTNIGYIISVTVAALCAATEMRAAILSPFLYFVFWTYKLYIAKYNIERQRVTELNELNARVISTLAMAIEAKDRYMHKHVERVREYAIAMAQELGIHGDDFEAIRIGSMIHDIGKIAVPESILSKPSKLTPEEHDRMKSHVTVGVKILESVDFPYPVEKPVLDHHERWDGNGYPNRKKGDEISIHGRIVALADGFDALTSDRYYRLAMSDTDALELIRSSAGKHYDPAVVDTLIKVLPRVKPRIDQLNKEESITDKVTGFRRMIAHEALEEITLAAEEAATLSVISLQPNVSHDPQSVINLLLEKVHERLPVTAAAVFLLDEESDEIRVAGCTGLYTHLLEDLTMKTGEGVSGWVVSHGQILVNEQAANDLARRVVPGQNLELSSCISVPLQVGGRCIGAITLYHTSYNLYDDHHQRVLIAFADHASNALDIVSRLETNHLLAHTDSLTDLPNMRFLIQHMEELTDEIGDPFHVLMLDLNRFKQINDRYGHLEGDRVLRETASLLRDVTRVSDVVGRYAGDEFVIISHSSKNSEALRIAQRIRKRLKEYQPFDDPKVHLTGSIGVASFPDDGRDWRTIFSVADRRMYGEKLRQHEGEIVDGEILLDDKPVNNVALADSDLKESHSMTEECLGDVATVGS